jgi:lysophospholipase L1-like esterase
MKEKIIFLGDSLTEWGSWSTLFPGYNIMNEGIAGNTTTDVLHRLAFLSGSDASKLFLMIGINDLANQTPVAEILENYGRIVEGLIEKFWDTRIYLISTLPVKFGRLGSLSLSQENLENLNKGINAIAEKNGLDFINMAPAFTDNNGKLKSEYTVDGLHLSKEGYLKWKEHLMNFLDN